MPCGVMTTYILVAQILGSHSLSIKDELKGRPPFCAETKIEQANAFINFKDKKGLTLFSTQQFVTLIDSYDSPEQHGGVPAKKIVLPIKIQKNPKSKNIQYIELKIPSRNFSEMTNIDSIESISEGRLL